jgi:hypothetical protein
MEHLSELYSRATVPEVDNVATNVSNAIDNAGLNDDYLTIENEHMKANISKMVLGKTNDRTKAFRIKYVNADSKRDGNVNQMNFALKSFVHGNDEKKAETARTIQKAIGKYGNVTRASFETETSLLDSMLLELKKPELAAALAELNLSAVVAELEANQNLFKDLFSQSSVTEAEKKEIVAPSKLKSETLEQLNSIVKYLNIRLRYHKATYGALAAEIAELINGLNTKIAMRLNSNSNTDDETENPEPNTQG